MENKNITNHGTLTDSTNWDNYFEAQINESVEHPAVVESKVVENKPKTSGVKSLTKAPKASQRHR